MYTIHTTWITGKFVKIDVGCSLQWTSSWRNHCGCNNWMATHSSRSCGLVAAVDLHRNLCIAPTHVVVMRETWERIRNYGWFTAITKVNVSQRENNCPRIATWVGHELWPYASTIGGQLRKNGTHYTHDWRWQPPWPPASCMLWPCMS